MTPVFVQITTASEAARDKSTNSNMYLKGIKSSTHQNVAM